jgi:hypothetical protein
MALAAEVGDVDVGANVSVDVGVGVGVDEVPLVELVPQATSKTSSIMLFKASTVPFEFRAVAHLHRREFVDPVSHRDCEDISETIS